MSENLIWFLFFMPIGLLIYLAVKQSNLANKELIVKESTGSSILKFEKDPLISKYRITIYVVTHPLENNISIPEVLLNGVELEIKKQFLFFDLDLRNELLHEKSNEVAVSLPAGYNKEYVTTLYGEYKKARKYLMLILLLLILTPFYAILLVYLSII
ncbi:MAG: hypothetical protein Fur003_0750 [Candidatus Dojkabacteria bacterium]